MSDDQKSVTKIVMKLEPGDSAVLQDFQLGVNHLNAAMGRFLGHAGVKTYGLTEGKAYRFEPNWKEGTVTAIEVPKPPEQKPTEQVNKSSKKKIKID